MCKLSAPTGSASMGSRCSSSASSIRKLKTCVTVSKITRHQCSSTHDLPSLVAHSRSSRRRVSRCSRCAWVDETGLCASREAVSALSLCRSCAAHDLPGLDLLVTRHHPNGRILQLPPSAPDCFANRLRTHVVFRG